MSVELFSSLCVPAKTGHPIKLEIFLEQYINRCYGPEAVKACQPDITTLHNLRNNIISQFNDDTSLEIRRIKQYLNLLMSLEERIPINDFGMLVNFTWSNCFLPHRTATFFSSVFERFCMLFRLAVAYNEYGGLQPIEQSSGLEKAAKCYQKSASIFEYIRKNCPPAYYCAGVWDLSPECLDVFVKILLAQSEETRKMKAILENVEPQRIFQLGSNAAHLYSAALEALSAAPAKCRFPKEWSGHLDMKLKLMKINAEHYASICDEQNGRHKEQFARKSRIHKLIRSIEKSPAKERMDEATRNIKSEIETLKKKHHFNMDDVAALEACLTLGEPMGMAQPEPINFPFTGQGLQPKGLFCRLQVMPCLAIPPEESYEPIITSEIDRLRGLTHYCNRKLASFNLPASQLPEDELRSALSKAASDVRESGGLTSLNDAVKSLESLCSDCMGLSKDISEIIQREEEVDKEFIMEFGQPLTDGSTAIQSGLHWRTLLSRYKFTLRQANSTDQFLRDVLGDNRQNFERLSLPKAEFDNLIENLMEKVNSQGHSRNPALSQLYTDVGRLRREHHNFELDFQKNFNERMTEILKSDANTRSFVNEELERLFTFVRKGTDCQKALLSKLGPISACVREINDVEETELSDLLFAAETYKQLQYDLKQGNMFYKMVLRILRHFYLTLTQVEENRAENIDNAAFAAFVNLLDKLIDDSPDDPPADEQPAKSSESTGESGPERFAAHSSFNGFQIKRSVLPNAKEPVVFPVKISHRDKAIKDDNAFMPARIPNPIVATYYLPMTGYPYRSGFLIPSWD